jgi:hypothetical protein
VLPGNASQPFRAPRAAGTTVTAPSSSAGAEPKTGSKRRRPSTSTSTRGAATTADSVVTADGPDKGIKRARIPAAASLDTDGDDGGVIPTTAAPAEVDEVDSDSSVESSDGAVSVGEPEEEGAKILNAKAAKSSKTATVRGAKGGGEGAGMRIKGAKSKPKSKSKGKGGAGKDMDSIKAGTETADKKMNTNTTAKLLLKANPSRTEAIADAGGYEVAQVKVLAAALAGQTGGDEKSTQG